MPVPSMPAATGGISGQESKMAKMLSECTAFQAWAGVSAQPDPIASALLRIYFDSLPPSADENYTLAEYATYRPYATIWTVPEMGYRRQRIAENVHSWPNKLVVALDQDVPSTYIGYISQMQRAFKNSIGAIILELCGMSGGAGYLEIDSVEMIGPFISSEDELPGRGNFQFVQLGFDVQ